MGGGVFFSAFLLEYMYIYIYYYCSIQVQSGYMSVTSYIHPTVHVLCTINMYVKFNELSNNKLILIKILIDIEKG